MVRFFGFFLGTYLYMELIYHFSCYGLSAVNPILVIPVWLFLAGGSVLLTGFRSNKVNKSVFWVILTGDYLLFASQLVYMKIFKQPLLIAAVTNAGKAAVTNYWREGLHAVLQASGWLLLLVLPLLLAGLLLKLKKLTFHNHSRRERITGAGGLMAGIVSYILVLVMGHYVEMTYFEEYSGFYDPEGVISEYGVTASVVRDLFGDAFPQEDTSLHVWEDLNSNISGEDTADDGTDTANSEGTAGADNTDDGTQGTDNGEDTQGTENTQPKEEEPELDTSPNVLPIDFTSLIANADAEKIADLAEFMQSMTPTNRNEYTGMFEGYNLIYLSAEGFCPYAVDENLTPTLYKLVNSGFVFTDYYVPLWQTSTSDGEYVNCTGLIPDQQFSMKRSADITMPFTLPAYFASEGVDSYAFHNNSLSYYERYRSHTNLGYNFMASKLGDLEEAEWGGQVFAMENANYWPASDLDMMKATVPYYIDDERFHVYYMTVSGHMNYNFSGNMMSYLHKEDVAGLTYSEEGRAYIACNMELDLALEYLITQLEEAGKLANTVICLSADHYPYAMEVANLEELAGKPLDGSLEIYRNNLILWNSEMETVTVDKTACSLDILPTLLNLFGFEYDSRLYVGRDILSDSTPLVIFSDRSFITDRVSYYKKGKEITWLNDAAEDEAYYETVKKQVRSLYNYAAGILNNDFYRYVQEALPEEYHSRIDPEWIAPRSPEEREVVVLPVEEETTVPEGEASPVTEAEETTGAGESIPTEESENTSPVLE